MKIRFLIALFFLLVCAKTFAKNVPEKSTVCFGDMRILPVVVIEAQKNSLEIKAIYNEPYSVRSELSYKPDDVLVLKLVPDGPDKTQIVVRNFQGTALTYIEPRRFYKCFEKDPKKNWLIKYTKGFEIVSLSEPEAENIVHLISSYEEWKQLRITPANIASVALMGDRGQIKAYVYSIAPAPAYIDFALTGSADLLEAKNGGPEFRKISKREFQNKFWCGVWIISWLDTPSGMKKLLSARQIPDSKCKK